jgi:hypothetical protein
MTIGLVGLRAGPFLGGRVSLPCLSNYYLTLEAIFVAKVASSIVNVGRETMARKKINKAAKIRETLEKLGNNARNKDVIATLAEQKITVAPAQVSNIRAALIGGASNRRGKRIGVEKISIASLQSAKKLIDEVGSIEAAKHALDVLGKLR